MEVDPPPPSSTQGPPVGDNLGLNPLKRSNSAPMLATTASQFPTRTCNSPVPSVSFSHSHSFCGHSFPKQFERIRRYSTSSTGLFSPATPQKTPSRLAQIINEERRNVKEREEAHERETHTNMQIYASCEELSLSDPSDQEPMVTDLIQRRPRSFQEPLHIFTSPLPFASSPSPTRIRKQCFSPSLGQPVRTLAGLMTPSPSPSPTRKSFARRSISPINMQPGRPLLKRKINMESSDVYESSTPQKRFHAAHSSCISPGSSTPERFSSMPHPLLHSVSSSSLSDNGSPEQQVPSTMDGSQHMMTTAHPHLHHLVAQSVATANQHLSHRSSINTTSSVSVNSSSIISQPQPMMMAFSASSRLSSNHVLQQSNHHHHTQSHGFGFTPFHNVQDSVETLSTSLSSSISQGGTESESSDMTESGVGEMIMDSNMMMSHSGLNSSGGSSSLGGGGGVGGEQTMGDLGGGGDFGMLSARFQQQQQKQSCKQTQL